MKKIIVNYSLEIFSACALLLTVLNLLFFPELSPVRKLVNAFAIMAILHEFEEKRTPGGFFKLMFKKFGIPEEQANVELASFFVIIYWVVILTLSYAFDNVAIFLIMSVALGIFEAFVHTAGIWLHHMKKPYTPGLASAWPMAFLSFYAIYCLNKNNLASGIDYALGTLLMVALFAIMQRGVLYACKMSYKDVVNNINALRSRV